MTSLFVDNWWALVVRGLLAIMLGVITFVWPGITLFALIILFGAYALLDGIVNITGAWRASANQERWIAPLLQGLAGIIAAAITIAWPGITALALVLVIAAWAILTGALEVAAAIKLRKHITGEWLLALTGILSIAFGVLLVIAPLAGALVIALWLGAYALVFGILLLVLGFRLRTRGRTFGAGQPIPSPSH